MPCDLCAAIAAGMPITADTPLPCRARPDSHEPDPADPFHGAVFTPPTGQRDFDESFVRALSDHQTSTTPAERVAAHAPHVARAKAHLARVAKPAAIDSLNPHPLDALKGT